VTGGAGYIGSILVNRLLGEGHHVRVIDRLDHGGDSLLGALGHPNFEFIKADIRNEKALVSSLRNIDCIVHLAAIVGEPLCSKTPEEAKSVNLDATRTLVDSSKESGVHSFLFASTCSNYGARSDEAPVNEDTALEAASLYAETKINAEQYVLKAKTSDFHPCVMRFATVYGLSPRMRFDLLVHEFIRDAVVSKKLAIYRPSFWRPLVHIRDVADAVNTIAQATTDRVSGRTYNVGGENFRKIQIGRLISEFYPAIEIVEVEGKEDPRNYRVSFDRLSSVLGFRSNRDLRSGISEVKRAIDGGVVTDPLDPKYGNVYYNVEELARKR